MGIKVANNAFGTLASSITNSATSITLTSGQGARFPTLSAGDYFYATLVDTSNNLEIVKCTARSTDVLTVTRAQENTTARAYSAGDRIEIRITAATFDEATNAASSEYDNTTSGLTATNVQDAVDEVVNDLANFEAIPSGAVQYFARNTAPTGYLKANGAAVSRSTYAALFSAIGTTFGSGNGSTTFNVPDLRGEFPRGWDDGRGADSGRAFGSAQAESFKSHLHGINGGAGAVTDWAGGSGADYGLGITNNTAINTRYEGGSETRPRNIALLACIKF